MHVQERFALAQLQQASQTSASQKVSFAQDVYVDLQRRFRKLNAVRIRASEVHVKTAHHSKPQEDAASPLSHCRPATKGTTKKMRLKPLSAERWHSTEIDRNAELHGKFALPGYILELREEMFEDGLDTSDADPLLNHREDTLDVSDLGVGLGAATASVSFAKEMPLGATAGSSQMWSSFRKDLPLGATTGSMQLSSFRKEMSLSATAGPIETWNSARGGTIGSRAANVLSTQLPSPKNACSKGGEIDVPRLPIIEKMPQHLASDIYRVHRPIYVPAAQLRWEKRDAGQTIISMRSEFIAKVCTSGAAAGSVQAAASCPERIRGTLSKLKPLETKTRGGMHCEGVRHGTLPAA